MPLLEVLQNQVCMTTEWHIALVKKWAEKRNFKIVSSTAGFIQTWDLRDTAVRATYAASEILGKKIKPLTDREIIKAGIDAVAD